MDLEDLEQTSSLVEVESVEIAAPERRFCRRGHGIFMSLALLGIGSLLTATGHISGTKFLALFQQDNSVCREVFQQEIDKGNSIRFAKIEFQNYQDISQGLKVHKREFANAAEAADILLDSTTNFMEVGKCTPESKTMLWFYPSEEGDHNGAFNLYEYECQRTSDLQNQQECVRLYRVENSYQAIQALNRQAPGSVVDLVLGGHGSDTTKGGSLILGYADEAVHWNDAEELFTAMAPKLAPQATVTLDSCHGAINKMAETASRILPSHWVFAGVVMTTGEVTVEQVPFDGGLEGPTHLPSNPGKFTAVNAKASLDALRKGYSEYQVGYEELPATKASGVELRVASADLVQWDAKTLDNYPVSSTKQYFGERLAAFYGGKNRGIVTQWMYPSKNGKVIQKGQKVKVAQPFGAWRSEMAEDQDGKAAAVIFTNVLPKGLTGTVLNVGATDGTPSAGNAMILFDLPQLESGCCSKLRSHK